MEVDHIVNAVFSSITWIIPVGDGKKCWLIDCGDIEEIISQGWDVQGTLLTHVHYDHIYGLNKLISFKPNAIVYTNAEGQKALYNPRWNFSRYHTDVEDFIFQYPENVSVFEGEGWYTLEDGTIVNVLFTLGHEPSCLTYHMDRFLFSGDAYIPGVKVVTTFPRSNKADAAVSLRRLRDLEQIGFKIMPGHKI